MPAVPRDARRAFIPTRLTCAGLDLGLLPGVPLSDSSRSGIPAQVGGPVLPIITVASRASAGVDGPGVAGPADGGAREARSHEAPSVGGRG